MATVNVSLEGADEIRFAMREAPKLANTFIRSNFRRAGKRWRKTFKKTQLGGRPGIFAPKMQKVRNRNVNSFTDGKFENLLLIFQISRFLRWHTEGATIPKRGGGGTFQLPKRLQFQATVNQHVPSILIQTRRDALRAVDVAFRKHQGANFRNLARALRG